MENLENCKVGDSIFSLIYGWGTVYTITKGLCKTPICVMFHRNGEEIFIDCTKDGKMSPYDHSPTIFPYQTTVVF